MNKQFLKGEEVNNSQIYYENLMVTDTDGNSYFLSPKDLAGILSQHDFQPVRKRTRVWLKPIKLDDTGAIVITDEVNEKLSAVLDRFEEETKHETAVKKISGGYAQADYSSHDNDWIYVTLRWGVSSDAENEPHEEDWKLAWYDFHKINAIRELVKHFEPCN